MLDLKIKTIEGNTLEFQGQLVGHAASCVDFTDQMKRRFELKLFKSLDLGFVPVIQFTTNAPNERSGQIAEVVDVAADVESCFFVFEPEEMLAKVEKLSREELADRKKLSNRMQAVYEKLAYAVLDQLDAFVNQPTSIETTGR